jgi:uncharacterized protein
MRIVIAGGTGFLGNPLAVALRREGHEVIVFTRSLGNGMRERDPAPGVVARVGWVPDGSAGPWSREVDGADAIVNLAGESIAARRWSAAQKARIRDSRILATRSLVGAIRAASQLPSVLVSGSAMGYYDATARTPLTEADGPGSDFLATIAVEWEGEALRAAELTRVVVVRTGIVLERDGGALAKMLPPFKLFAGGPVGSGDQYWSWIHRDDWIAMVRWALETQPVTGPINATAPQPVTNREFCKALGRALGRPSWLPAPAFALRLLLGEMADPLLLEGAPVLPAKATELGFRFQYPELDEAFRAIFTPRT